MRSPKGLTKQQHALHEFLDLLCIERGFCIPAEAADMISRRTRLTSVEFATAILHAEGMHPEHERSSMAAENQESVPGTIRRDSFND